jgi:hypothetical protein
MRRLKNVIVHLRYINVKVYFMLTCPVQRFTACDVHVTAGQFLSTPGVYAAGYAVYLPPYPNMLELYKDSLPTIR